MAKLVRQEMPPAGGFTPVAWKRLAHRRKIPLSFVMCTYLSACAYSAYKLRMILFEKRINSYHYNAMQTKLNPFLYAEEDRLKVRARKQHETDITLILGPQQELSWDPHRRAYQNEDVFVDYSRHEMLPLLTDQERVALGGEPSRYSFNDMWQESVRNKAHDEDTNVKYGRPALNKLE